jgi:hypothetical protein
VKLPIQKFIRFGFVFLVACSSPTDQDNKSDNLVKNPGFEESSNGIEPDDWEILVMGYESGMYMDSLNEHSGQYSCRIIYDPEGVDPLWSGEFELRQKIGIEKFDIGAECRLSMWIKTDGIRLLATIGRSGYWWGPFLSETWIEKQTDWQKYEAVFIALVENLVEDNYIRIFIDYQTANKVGFAWVDDVVLEKIAD